MSRRMEGVWLVGFLAMMTWGATGAIRNGGVWWVTFGVSALMVLSVMRNRDKLR